MSCFETAYLGKNARNLLWQKAAQMLPFHCATSFFKKIMMHFQKKPK